LISLIFVDGSSQTQVDAATALANTIKTEELGKNEARLMAYASAVLKGNQPEQTFPIPSWVSRIFFVPFSGSNKG